MTEFVDNDEGYLAWIDAHPEGYVVNCYRKPTASYLILRRGRCSHIQRAEGRRNTVDYIKVCSDSEPDLRNFAEHLGGSLTRCQSCQP